jgi:CHAD domain-containing protein
MSTETQGKTPQSAEGETPEATPTEAPKNAELESALQRIKELNKENADRRKKLEAFEKSEAERKQAEMTELEKLQTKLKELQDRATAAERREMQRQAAEKAKLPAEFSSRLQGETPEELEADAAKLAAALPKPQPGLQATNPAQGTTKPNDAQWRDFFAGGNLPK